MENASKALLIGGGVLIALLVLSIGVNLFVEFSSSGSSYEKNIGTIEIEKFNSNFLKFEGREDITIQEIITLANFAKQYKEKTGINIQVSIPGKTNLILTSDNTIELIKKNTNQKFTCSSIQDYREDGKIQSISFSYTP